MTVGSSLHIPNSTDTMSVISRFPLADEDVCRPENPRRCLRPYLYPVYMEFHQEMCTRFWQPKEINYAQDRADFQSLTPDAQFYVSSILGFFANADNVAIENLEDFLKEDITSAEAHAALTAQAFFESIHAITYNDMINAVIENEAEKRKLFQSVETDPFTRRKIEVMEKYAARDRPFHQRVLAQAFWEGVLFQPNFAALFWLRKDQKCQGICFGNMKILEDECIHVRMFCYMAKTRTHKIPDDEVHAMLREYVQVAVDFVNDKCPYDMEQMNKHLMKQFIEHTADVVLKLLGMPPIYNQPQPFEFMNTISLYSKTNFFEVQASEYTITSFDEPVANLAFDDLGFNI